MDAFYASVELLRYPELRGMPVVIGGGSRHQPIDEADPLTGTLTRRFTRLRGYVGRGVITTATYEARAFGLRSAMGMMKAAQLAPDTVLLPVDFDRYRKYSRMFKAAVRAIAPQIEDRGIDEIYIDLTELVGAAADPWARVREIGGQIRRAVRESTGLSCSIGVSPNKLLSKIASDLDKPDGLTLLRPEDIAARIWPLPPRKINGVGPKASAKLTGLGIATIGLLAEAEPAYLVSHFGRNYGLWLHECAKGQDERPIVTSSEPTSISRETTFERDLHPARDRDELREIFTELCQGLTDDLQRKGYVGKTIGLKLRYDDFRTVTRARTLEAPTQDMHVIRRTAGECLKSVDLERKIRLLGVRASSLEPADGAASPATGRLFD
ncbi:MAG: DNA polymerase IV [Betaproteobacteria bacterium]